MYETAPVRVLVALLVVACVVTVRGVISVIRKRTPPRGFDVKIGPQLKHEGDSDERKG